MRIGVLMGGISTEREVSLKSGTAVINSLNKEKYEAVPIIIDSKRDVIEKVNDIDFAFIALHGKFGEDGTVQGILEAMGIPYSGCNVLTSAICMNKSMTKDISKVHGLPTAPWCLVRAMEEIDYDVIEEIGYPVFIKPNNGGSSVATFFVTKPSEVKNAVQEGLKVDTEVIIEKYIAGEEITSFVLNGEVFPTLMIKAKKGTFFDYASKYEDNGSDEVLCFLEDKIQKQVNEISSTIWNVLGCKSYARIDMIISKGIPYVLEVNTLPGLTPASLIPKSAKAKGYDFSELLDKMIQYSLT